MCACDELDVVLCAFDDIDRVCRLLTSGVLDVVSCASGVLDVALCTCDELDVVLCAFDDIDRVCRLLTSGVLDVVSNLFSKRLFSVEERKLNLLE